MDAKKIAKNTGKGAGIVAMAFLAGMAATAQAQAEQQEKTLRRRPFQPRFSDEHDIKFITLTSGDDKLTLAAGEDSTFYVIDSTIKGCKTGRVVTFKDPSVAREFQHALQRNFYLREINQQEKMYCSRSYSPLLFEREDKHGEMVPCFLDKGWDAALEIEATV